MAKLFTREAFLSAGRGRRFHEFDVPGLGRVRIRSLTERERQRHERQAMNAEGEFDRDRATQARCRLIVATVVGEDGQPFLTEADVAALEDQDALLTLSIEREAVRHCGIRRRVGDFLPDSEETDGSGSPVASPPSADS